MRVIIKDTSYVRKEENIYNIRFQVVSCQVESLFRNSRIKVAIKITFESIFSELL